MSVHSSATDHSQKFKEILLKDLLICVSKLLVIIKNLRISCKYKMCKTTI